MEATMTSAENKKSKVMVAIDESDESFNALKWALDNVFRNYTSQSQSHHQQDEDEEGEAVITLVNVQPPFQPFVYPTGPVVFATPTVIDTYNKARQQIAKEILSRALQMCKQKMVKAETLVLEGDPKDRICQAAEEMHTDLLVVGSRGLGKITRTFLGSVSDYCAHHTHCPVLIVKLTHKEPSSVVG